MPRRKATPKAAAEPSPSGGRMTRRSLKGKTAHAAEESEENAEEPVVEQPKARGRKSAPVASPPVKETPKRGAGRGRPKKVDEAVAEVEKEEAAPAPKKGRRSAAAKQPAGRGKKAVEAEASDNEEPAAEDVPAESKSKGRGRGRRSAEPPASAKKEPEDEPKPKGRRGRKSAAETPAAVEEAAESTSEATPTGRGRRSARTPRASTEPEAKTPTRKSGRGAKKAEAVEDKVDSVDAEPKEDGRVKRKREEDDDAHEKPSAAKKAKHETEPEQEKSQEAEPMEVDETTTKAQQSDKPAVKKSVPESAEIKEKTKAGTAKDTAQPMVEDISSEEETVPAKKTETEDDYVVIERKDVPAADSAEIKAIENAQSQNTVSEKPIVASPTKSPAKVEIPVETPKVGESPSQAVSVTKPAASPIKQAVSPVKPVSSSPAAPAVSPKKVQSSPPKVNITPQAASKVPVSPVKQPAVSPVKQTEASPVKQAEASPVKKAEASPVKQAEASPVKQAEASPVKKAEASPVKKAESSPIKQAEVSPVKQGEASPVKKAEASLVKQAEASPVKQADASPIKQAETSPVKQAEVSPVKPKEVIPPQIVISPAKSPAPPVEPPVSPAKQVATVSSTNPVTSPVKPAAKAASSSPVKQSAVTSTAQSHVPMEVSSSEPAKRPCSATVSPPKSASAASPAKSPATSPPKPPVVSGSSMAAMPSQPASNNAGAVNSAPSQQSPRPMNNGSSITISNNHINSSHVQTGAGAVDSNVDHLLNRVVISNPFVENTMGENSKFTVGSYNILADCHVMKDKDKYKNINQELLSLPCRHKRLLAEFGYLDCDVLCLQEVDSGYYSETLKPAMADLGYSGLYYKRRSPMFDEGEATFYKSNRFTLVTDKVYHLTQLAHKDLESSGIAEETKTAVKQFVDEPSVFIITQLKCNLTSKVVTVGNIHVCWQRFEKPDLQCVQIACAMRELVSVAGGPDSAHVICGDFNCWPETSVYQLMTEGYLNDHSVGALQALQNIKVGETSTSLLNAWWQGFQHTSPSIKSSYKTVTGGEPSTAMSNSTGIFRKLDYIWYASSKLGLLNVLSTPGDDIIKPGIPSKIFPSDHLSIKAQFYFL